MKKILIILMVVVLSSCVCNTKQPTEEINTNTPKHTHLMGEIRHGLNLITINDTTQILIYRGMESCTMIKL